MKKNFCDDFLSIDVSVQGNGSTYCLALLLNGHSLLQTGGRATDLVTGVYEGGLRVWEGSLDLVRYLDAHKDTVLFTQDHQDMKKKKKGAKKNKKGKGRGGGKRSDGGNGARSLPSLRCLDLGCGHGLPGLYALRAKGSRWRVCFSDFNAEVNVTLFSFMVVVIVFRF